MMTAVAAGPRKTKALTLLRWKASEAKTLALCVTLAIICGTIFLVYAQRVVNSYNTGTLRESGDFFALWSYAKIASSYPATELYDFAALHTRQVALGMAPTHQAPFPYPPTAILVLLPLSFLPYDIAYVFWVAATFALFLWAVVATCWRSPGIVLPVLIAPTTTTTIPIGQSGFLAGALLIGGIRLAATRPIISGVLLGILSYKPQLGLLVPVALASAGLWRTFGVACSTAVGLAIVATAAFGWGVWPAWIDMLPAYAQWFANRDEILKFMPTVEANLRMVGIAPTIAGIVQIIVAIAVGVVVWKSFRKGPSESRDRCPPGCHIPLHAACPDLRCANAHRRSRPVYQVSLADGCNFQLGGSRCDCAVSDLSVPYGVERAHIPLSSLSLLFLLAIIVAGKHSALTAEQSEPHYRSTGLLVAHRRIGWRRALDHRADGSCGPWQVKTASGSPIVRLAIRAAIVNHRTEVADVHALVDAVLAANRRRG